MAQTTTPTTTATPSEEAFVADRQIFWARFTGFAKWAAIAIAALLVALLVFIY